MSDRIPMTRGGYSKLEDELHNLKTVERPQNVRDIEEARAHGDISENAEFHAAKERQSHIEGRIRLVEDRLARAQVIELDDSAPPDDVRFGVTAVLLDTDAAAYGGSGASGAATLETLPEHTHGHAQCLSLTLPPLAALVLKPE